MSIPKVELTKPRRAKQSYAPLSYERAAILTALAMAPLDRAKILGAIIGDTVGELVLKKSSFYRLIAELEADGFIEQKGPYFLTDKGWRSLRHELYRI